MGLPVLRLVDYQPRDQGEESKSKGTHHHPWHTSCFLYPSFQSWDFGSSSCTKDLHFSESSKNLVDNRGISDVTKVGEILPKSHTEWAGMRTAKNNEVRDRLTRSLRFSLTIWDNTVQGNTRPKPSNEGTWHLLFNQSTTTHQLLTPQTEAEIWNLRGPRFNSVEPQFLAKRSPHLQGKGDCRRIENTELRSTWRRGGNKKRQHRPSVSFVFNGSSKTIDSQSEPRDSLFTHASRRRTGRDDEGGQHHPSQKGDG